MTNRTRMSELCSMFPTLDRAEGTDPFDPEVLDAWACGPAPCHGGVYAARFILSVWSGHTGHVEDPRQDDEMWVFPTTTPWRSGLFDVVDALGTWDQAHRTAFVAWAKAPWWP